MKDYLLSNRMDQDKEHQRSNETFDELKQRIFMDGGMQDQLRTFTEGLQSDEKCLVITHS